MKSITGFTTQTATVNGINLHYYLGDTGQPLLLWHGFLETSYCWRKVMPLLAQRYTVIAPDMRGYGDSDKPADGYDAQTLADDFRGLVQQLGFKKLYIVAHDMGAPPALLYAGRYPDEVLGVVYIDEPTLTRQNLQAAITFTPEQTQNGGLWWWAMALAGDMAERLIVGHERQFLTWFYETYTATPGSIEPEAVDEYLRSFAGPGGVSGAFGVYRAIWASVEQTEAFVRHQIAVSLLGLGGEMSMGEHTRQMLFSVGSDVQGGAMPHCGHFPADEQPDELVSRINAFFAERRIA